VAIYVSPHLPKPYDGRNTAGMSEHTRLDGRYEEKDDLEWLKPSFRTWTYANGSLLIRSPQLSHGARRQQQLICSDIWTSLDNLMGQCSSQADIYSILELMG
jgi:hypothetical protein